MKIIHIFILFLSLTVVAAQRPLFDFNKSLGKGVNLGNIFEAPTEGSWGNPFQDDFFVKIKQAGFDHVRIPTRWDTPERCMQTSPYTISPVFIKRMKDIVDLALEQKLKVVLNMHHHEEIFTNPAGVKPRFLSQWKQIAEYFKNYSTDLVFEVMNEPHDLLTPELWNVYFADALKEIRTSNPSRVVLMGVAEYGGLAGLGKLVPPTDSNVIITIHYYNPFQFTHQGADWVGTQSQEWLGTKWNDLEEERNVIRQEFAAAKRYEQDYNIPIHIGEFGAYDKADLASRTRWSTFIARYLESIGFSWAYWEWSAGFGVYNPNTGQFKSELLDAIISNPLPEPTKTILTPIFESDFSNTSGWNLFTNGGATATMNANGNLNITITKGGSQSWHVQLVRNGFNLVKDKMYKLSFEGKSESKNSLTFYLGKASDPWNSYSGYNGVTLSNEFQEYSSVFTMKSNTDPIARMVFDMGNQTGAVSIRKVKLEEVKLDFGSSNDDFSSENIEIYPNPTDGSFSVKGLSEGEYALNIYDSNGKLVHKTNVTRDLPKVESTNLRSGFYTCEIIGKKRVVVQFIVK